MTAEELVKKIREYNYGSPSDYPYKLTEEECIELVNKNCGFLQVEEKKIVSIKFKIPE